MTSLFRRKKDCYYGEAFVVSNQKVDNHIHKVYQGVKQRVRALLNMYHSACTHFKEANLKCMILDSQLLQNSWHAVDNIAVWYHAIAILSERQTVLVKKHVCCS